MLPIAGFGLTVVYFENQVAGVWLKNQGFYFWSRPCIGDVAHLSGWNRFPPFSASGFGTEWMALLEQLPILGNLYQTLKQILGYGEGPKGLLSASCHGTVRW